MNTNNIWNTNALSALSALSGLSYKPVKCVTDVPEDIQGGLDYFFKDPDVEIIEHHMEPERIKMTEGLLLKFCHKNRDGSQHLHLAGNFLQEKIQRRFELEDYAALTEFLEKYKNVASLDLSYNQISILELIQLFLCLIKIESGMHYLNLMNTSMGIQELEYLADKIRQTTIKMLRINNNQLGRESGLLVRDILLHNTCLTFLDVGGIDSDWGLLSCIASALQDKELLLEVLDVSRIVPQSLVSYDQGEHVAEFLEIIIMKSSSLRQLYARHNSMTGHDIENLVAAVRNSRTLQYLDIAGNRIGDHGAEILADALKSRPNLIGLNISNNDIGDLGGRALGHAIPFSKLLVLDVSLNRMGHGGLRILIHTLKKPQFLRILSISGNKFDSDTAKIIHRMQQSEVLRENAIDVRSIPEDGVYRVVGGSNPSHVHRTRYYGVNCSLNNYATPNSYTAEEMKLDFAYIDKSISKVPVLIYVPPTRKLRDSLTQLLNPKQLEIDHEGNWKISRNALDEMLRLYSHRDNTDHTLSCLELSYPRSDQTKLSTATSGQKSLKKARLDESVVTYYGKFEYSKNLVGPSAVTIFKNKLNDIISLRNEKIMERNKKIVIKNNPEIDSNVRSTHNYNSTKSLLYDHKAKFKNKTVSISAPVLVHCPVRKEIFQSSVRFDV